jgi:hypothetical protein
MLIASQHSDVVLQVPCRRLLCQGLLHAPVKLLLGQRLHVLGFQLRDSCGVRGDIALCLLHLGQGARVKWWPQRTGRAGGSTWVLISCFSRLTQSTHSGWSTCVAVDASSNRFACDFILAPKPSAPSEAFDWDFLACDELGWDDPPGSSAGGCFTTTNDSSKPLCGSPPAAVGERHIMMCTQSGMQQLPYPCVVCRSAAA